MITKNVSLEELGLSTRSYNALKRSTTGDTIEKLLTLCVCDVMDIPLIGTNNMLEIVDALKGHSMNLHECNKAK